MEKQSEVEIILVSVPGRATHQENAPQKIGLRENIAVGGRATDIRRSVRERLPIHTHTYRFEARGERMRGESLRVVTGFGHKRKHCSKPKQEESTIVDTTS